MPPAEIIDGKAMAAALTASLAAETAALAKQTKVRPGLAVVLVGADPASHVYVRNKGLAAESLGFHSVQHTLEAGASEDDVLSLIDRLNRDSTIHGILVQLPLPDHLDERRITQHVDPGKDVDGFHFLNIGKLSAGCGGDGFIPCTPAGCMLMIENRHGKDLSGLSAVVIGRSNIVGKPMASLLLKANATVTICHSRTRNLPGIARSADILVAATGRPHMIGAEWIKPGATVIDVGISRIETTENGEARTRLAGDVNFGAAAPVAGAITPVPGGVGPMTIVMLMANTLKSARMAAGHLPGGSPHTGRSS